jgi:hypothetical protein
VNFTLSPSAYVTALRAALDDLPGPPLRFRSTDRRLALELYRRCVPFELLRAALHLATLRRLVRHVDRPRLAPVRSLYYYLPVVDELLAQSLDPAWVHHLASRLARLKSQALPSGSILSAPVQNSAFPSER